jgi:hypothetical protein
MYSDISGSLLLLGHEHTAYSSRVLTEAPIPYLRIILVPYGFTFGLRMLTGWLGT